MKKLISVIIVVGLVLGLVPFSFAEGEIASEPKIKVSDVYAQARDTVSVDVFIENNPGIFGAKLTFEYAEGLTLIDSSQGEALSVLTMTKPGKYTSPCSFGFDGESISEEDIKDGTVLTLVFEIEEGSISGKEYFVKVSYKHGDIFDADYEDLELLCESGFVTVVDYTLGDVNDDTFINVVDIVLMRRHFVGGYDIQINEAAADINGDGNVNAKDVNLIRQYLVGNVEFDFTPAHRCLPNLVEVEASAVSCVKDGNIAYWYCSSCEKCYTGSDATGEIAYEDAQIRSEGHKTVVDEAVAPTYENDGLTEGSHCSVCGEVFVAQTVIPKLEAYYHSITYNNLNGAAAPDKTSYAEHEGVKVMPTLSVDGYVFKGWYTDPFEGEKVSAIPAGSTEDYVLYARWEIITYKIVYDCKNGTNAETNVSEYTVNDTVIFAEPTLKGYVFAGWIDEDGATVSRLQKGSVGDIVLTATWKTARCIAHPIDTIANPLFAPVKFVHEEDSDEYTYIYYLGYIENIPLGWNGEYQYYNGVVNIQKEFSTSTIEGTEIAETISDITEDTRGWQSTFSVESDSKIECPFVVEQNIKVSISDTQTGSTTKTHEDGTVTTTTEERVEAVTEISDFSNSPVGFYRYVNLASVDVFATVTYNAAEDTYYLANFNAVRYVSQGWDYSAKSSSFDDEVDSDLPFEMPDTIKDVAFELTQSTKIQDFVFEEGVDANGRNVATLVDYKGNDKNVIVPTYYVNDSGISHRVVGIKNASSDSDGVFAGSDIETVKLGDYITRISDYAFHGCTSLKNVTASSITEIGAYAFYGCSSLDYTVTEGITYIGESAFEGCISIDKVEITENVTYLGTKAFDGCGELDLYATVSNHSVIAGLSDVTATKLTLNLSQLSGEGDTDFTAVDTVKEFYVVSGPKNGEAASGINVAYGLRIDSYAAYTEIKDTVIVNVNTAVNHALEIYSPVVCLNNVEVTVSKISGHALWLRSGEYEEIETSVTELIVRKGVKLTGSGTGEGLRCGTNVYIHSADNFAGELYVSAGENSGETGTRIFGDVFFGGYLSVYSTGGRGNDGLVTGGVGEHGGHGIVADNITVDINGTFSAVGGDGGNGRTGESFDWWVDGNGRAGKAGGDGGRGGNAMITSSLTILNANKLKLILVSGNGGKGGNGGIGESANRIAGTVRVGGRGGDGGDGGDAGKLISCSGITATSNEISCDQKLLSFSASVGSGGNGGNGGRGGHGDDYKFLWLHEWSNPGEGGSAGAAGLAGKLGYEEGIFVSNNITEVLGTVGKNGAAGAKGSSDGK